MNLSNISIKRPVATIMIMLMVVVLGVSAFIGIQQDLFPDIKYPVALVMTNYDDASPEEVETMVTKPIEQALASVEGLDEMYSMSMQGVSVVMVQFQMDTDMNFATLNMREKIALVSDFLPDSTGDPMVMKMDMSSIPVVQVYISGDMSLCDLNNEVEDKIVSYFERVSGVASVSVNGAIEEEVSVKIDQERLSGYGISLAQVAQVLAAENINMPSGDVNKGDTEVIVRTLGEFKSVQDISNLPLTLMDRSIVRLGEIATIKQQYQEQKTISRIDGKTAIGIMVTKQSDANVVEVSDDVIKEIDRLQEKFPELTFTVGFNQADFIKSSISSVSRAAILGALLAVIVVFIFLKNIRTTLVVAMSIPISLLATFWLMSAKGMTLNMITLCALTLTVGMLVDNSIVVLENIFRIRQEIPDAVEAAQKGSKEILLAIISSTLTTVVVFLPIALSGGITGLMFKDFCFTIIIALLASLVVAVTIVPMLCSKLLTRGISSDYIRVGSHRYKFRYLHKFTRFIEDVKESYGQIMVKLLKKRKRVILTCILIFVISIASVVLVGTELLPKADENTFKISVGMPYGTSLEDKDSLMTEIESYILKIPEVMHCTIDIGTTNIMSMSDDSTLNITLISKRDRKRSTEEIVWQTRKDLSYITGADLKVEETSAMTSMFGGGTDFQLSIKGNELEKLIAIGDDLCNQIMSVKNVVSAETDVTEGNPELKVIIDRNTASYYGVTSYQLAEGLSSSLSGKTATKLKVDGEEIEVNLSLPSDYSDSVENLKQIIITGSTGMKVPVGQIATFEYDNSPTVINRANQVRLVTLNIDISGNDLGAVSEEIMSVVDNYQFPDGYYYETGGQQEEMVKSFASLGKALVVAIALVYLVLAAQFESLTLPFMVLMSVPFAMSGAFLAMFITGTSLSMVSFLGLIMLAGIVVNNAILLVEFINQNKESMGIEDALISAGKLRLRPILMSAGTTCVGMVPLAMGVGEGGEVLAPLGISIIGGMIASTIITLILIPVLYYMFDDIKANRKNKREQKYKRVSEWEAKWKEEDTVDGK